MQLFDVHPLPDVEPVRASDCWLWYTEADLPAAALNTELTLETHQ
jgi:hypothetical protein